MEQAKQRRELGPSWYFAGVGENERIVAGPCIPDRDWEKRKVHAPENDGRFEYIGNASIFTPEGSDEPKFLVAFRKLVGAEPRVQPHIDRIEEHMRQKTYERTHGKEMAAKLAVDAQAAQTAAVAGAVIAQLQATGVFGKAGPGVPETTDDAVEGSTIKRGPGRPPKVPTEV